jgi:hypothetical protein
MKTKIYFGTEIRRLTVDNKTTFQQLLKTIKDLWTSEHPNDSNILSQLTFKYLDLDNDWVSFSTSEEWKEVLSNVKEDLKIKIEKKNQKEQEKMEQKPTPIENNFGGFNNFLNPQMFQNLMTPENMEIAKNLFSQFNGGNVGQSNDLMKMFSAPNEISKEQLKESNETLVGMGFIDASVNEKLLNQYHGNIQQVVNHYLQ